MEIKRNIRTPKVFHFIWVGGKMPKDTEEYIELTREMYPDWEVKIWTEKELDVNKHKYSRLAYQQKKWAFVSDFFRVRIMLDHGGVYLDTDMIPVRRIDSLIKNKVVIGFEYSKMISTGFVAAEKDHPIFRKLVSIYESFDNLPDNKIKFIVNNELWTLFLVKTYGLKLNNKPQLLLGDIQVQNQNHFSDFKKSLDTYFLHDHQLSWTSPVKRKLMIVGLKITRRFNLLMKPILVLQKEQYFLKNKRILKNVDNNIKKQLFLDNK